MLKQEKLNTLAKRIREKSLEQSEDEIILNIRRKIKEMGYDPFMKKYFFKNSKTSSQYSVSQCLRAVLDKSGEKFDEEEVKEEKSG